MKFTKIREETFKELQLNAGMILKSFNPVSATVSTTDILMATSGGIKFEAKPEYTDMGEDIDNCPKNMAELKKLDTWEIKLSGTAVTVTPDTVKSALAAADVAGDKITPRNDIKAEDFTDLWWVGDYSDQNGETNGGFCAIHMMKTLSTGGFSIETNDKVKGKFAFEYTAHYSLADQSTVPFEVYVKAGTTEVV